MQRVQSGNALARFHICKQATVQWRRTEIIAMPIVQNLCDFCIKTIPICWISSSNVSWVVSYIHLDIQAVFCRCYVGLLCIASRGNAWGWFRCTAELYRALINALVLGSTDWSHCLNAYSMLFKLPANLNSSTRWLTLIFNGTRDHRLIHGQLPSCVTQAGNMWAGYDWTVTMLLTCVV